MKEFIFKKIDISGGILDLKASLFESSISSTKGVLLYFHGGGFIYGSRMDLSAWHLEKLRNAGYAIFSFDYRLAPEGDFHFILEDAMDAINFFIKNRGELGYSNTPYFLWGRSAGAYLALLTTVKSKIISSGIISYYGYGFTKPHWYNTGSAYYLKYPKVSKGTALALVQNTFITETDINKRYLLYLYARQSGRWLSLLSRGSEEDFIKNYSLSNLDVEFKFPPTFLAHNFKDSDVPFGDSLELSRLIKGSILFTCSEKDHDFDNKRGKTTMDLLDRTIAFLDKNI